MLDSSPLKIPSKRRSDESASDIDFADGDSDGDDDSEGIVELDPKELSTGSVTTPSKGKATPKKVTALQPSSKKQTPIKTQQVPAKKIGVPIKPPSKNVQTPPKKIVSSKKSGEVSKAQNGQTNKPINPAKSANIKQKAPVAKSTAVGKANNGMQTNNSTKSKTLPAKPVNGTKQSVSTNSRLTSKPAASTKTASAEVKMASKPTESITATTKPKQLMANSPSQSTDLTTKSIAHLPPCAPPKTNLVKPSLISSTVQMAAITNSTAASSMPRQDLLPMPMDLDNQPAQLQLQATEMDLDINPQKVPVTCTRMELEIPSQTNELPRLILRFCHPSKMVDITKTPQCK